MARKEQIYDEKIRNLLRSFVEKSYSSSKQQEDETNKDIIDTCTKLWQRDYKCEMIDNSKGIICETYPSSMILPLYEIGTGKEALPSSCPVKITSQTLNPEAACTVDIGSSNLSINEETPTFASVVAGASADFYIPNINETKLQSEDVQLGLKFRTQLKGARAARCRCRVPFPVILCKGKYISRAGTLSILPDVCSKLIYIYATDPIEETEELKEAGDDTPPGLFFDKEAVEAARSDDIKLLKILGVSHIIDLMVEYKKQRFYMNVSSSEKADSKNRYFEFDIASMPYPGCEFFVNFTNNSLSSEDLEIDWSSATNDALLSLPDGFNSRIPSFISKDWESYKSWDLRKLTVNYLQYILDYVTDEQSKLKGLLIHCISGWDRTPLFISLTRLSLWADGFIHSSLDATQILYLTLAYDWYLFGHQLHIRRGLKENIMYFCFEILEFIDMDNDINYRNRHLSADSENAESIEKGGLDTLSLFGSTSSIDSITNNLQSNFSQQSNIRISNSSHNVSEETQCSWPFNKENGFSFDGISENEEIKSKMSVLTVSSIVDQNGVILSDNSKKVSPTRSPLKEWNNDTPSKRNRRISGEELNTSTSSTSISPIASSFSDSESKGELKSSNSLKKSNLNGYLKDFTGRRSRKISTTEPPARFHVASDLVIIDTPDFSGNNENEAGIKDISSVSNPVAVPGTRPRHDSLGSSIGSWQFLSPSEAMETHRSSVASFAANMEESTTTIQEESTPSTSVESNSQSIIVFNKRRRLAEVKDKFYKLFGEVSSLQQERSGIVDLLSNMVQRVVT